MWVRERPSNLLLTSSVRVLYRALFVAAAAAWVPTHTSHADEVCIQIIT